MAKVTRNANVQYESLNIYYFIKNNVYFFAKKMSNVKVKRFSANKKILSQGIFTWNMKILALTVKNLLARLDFKK